MIERESNPHDIRYVIDNWKLLSCIVLVSGYQNTKTKLKITHKRAMLDEQTISDWPKPYLFHSQKKKQQNK